MSDLKKLTKKFWELHKEVKKHEDMLETLYQANKQANKWVVDALKDLEKERRIVAEKILDGFPVREIKEVIGDQHYNLFMDCVQF